MEDFADLFIESELIELISMETYTQNSNKSKQYKKVFYFFLFLYYFSKLLHANLKVGCLSDSYGIDKKSEDEQFIRQRIRYWKLQYFVKL